MKVLFIKDLAKVAKKNDVKEQPDGYARNFLIPKGYAIIATPDAVKKVEREQTLVRVEREVQSDLFKKNLRAVAGVGVTIAVKANENGHLFKAVHEKDISEALKKEHHIVIEPSLVKVAQQIKNVGTYTVGVEALGMREEITVNVIAGK